MNNATQTTIRAILKIGAGYFVANGIASDSDATIAISVLTAIIAYVWGLIHRTGSTPSATTPVKMLFIFAIASLTLFGVAGCKSSAITTANKVQVGEHITSNAALTIWDDYVKTHTVPIAYQIKVRDAYNKLRDSQILFADALVTIKEIDGTNSVGIGILNPSLLNAVTQNLDDLITLIRGYGAKI